MPPPRTADLLAAFDGFTAAVMPTPMPPAFAADLDATPAAEWLTLLGEVLAAVGGWHCRPSPAEAEWVRHGLSHLRRGDGTLADRLVRCATADSPYFVAGVGWRFWAAAAKTLDPDRLPLWCPDVRAGCGRFGLTAANDLAGSFAAVATIYDEVLDARPEATAGRLDAFFRAVGRGVGREPGHAGPDLADRDQRIRSEVRAVRAEVPLRNRASHPTATDPAAVLQGVAAAANESPAVPAAAGDWFARLEAVMTPDELASLDGWLIGDGLWLTAGVLHRRHPRRFPPWSKAIAAGHAALDDAVVPGLSAHQRYRLMIELAAALRAAYRVHPAEVGELLTRLGRRPSPPSVGRFGGFCRDSFRFLSDLDVNNTAAWMAAGRGRYRYAVRGPLVELCQALAERYVRPVLGGEYGWHLETAAKPGRALSSVCKNDYGQSGPYQPVMWATFYQQQDTKKTAAQLFARLAADGLSVGFHLSRTARTDGRRFRANVQAHGPLLFEALQATGGTGVRFAGGIDAPGILLGSAADLREWAANKDLVAAVRLAPAEAVARTDELVGDAILTFDRLVPLYAAAVLDDPTPVLLKRAGRPAGGFDRTAFREATLLADPWLDRALGLLQAKRQLVLQGVPGTGKTHVARCLARHLTGDRPEQLTTVQFHPAYSYEEFVEGLRPTTGGGPAGYAVEPGVLRRVAERAARHPADPHVLLVDELNRGNLPRVFGELLYLLEYRDQAVTLPTSKAEFRLPPNLFVLATLNPADRSVTPLDQATRRRFAFLDMPPEFGGHLVNWFERVNRHLLRDFGPERQIGHAYWLREQMDRHLVRTVWEHEVRPALSDLFPGSLTRLDALAPGRTFDPLLPRRRPARSAAR